MFTPHTYSIALLLMILTMLCWGSWVSTPKIPSLAVRGYSFDYTIGLLVLSLCIG
jgi:glucose uptake protein